MSWTTYSRPFCREKRMNAPRPSRSGLTVLAICFLTILADGFDLIIYGATLPSLMEQWGLSKHQLANVHSMTLAGLMVGFLVAGPLADRIGRRIVLIGGGAWFSVLCTLCAFAPNFGTFGAARVLAGLGLGAVVPSAVALANEFAPAGRRQLFNGITLMGYAVGGILTTLAALALIPGAEALKEAARAGAPDQSWRIMYGIAAAFLLLIPFMWLRLPESPSFLVTRGRDAEAAEIAATYGMDFDRIVDEQRAHEALSNKGGYQLLLSPKYVVATIIFTLIMFCTQVLSYGPNTWLPSMTKEMGFGGVQGTLALMMLQIGAAAGTLVGAVLVDRGEAPRVVVPYFLIGAVSLAALAYGTELGAAGIFIAAFFTGVGTIGTSTLMYGVIASYYPAASRSSAIGFTLGIGRLGAILGPQIGAIFATPRQGLLAFTVPCLVGAVLVGVLALLHRGRSLDAHRVAAEEPTPVSAR